MQMDHRDYYQILGVPRDADSQAIKRAFRRLARQHHPDLNNNDRDAERRFKEINEAYAVLSDPEKRRFYDQLGGLQQQLDQASGFNRSGWMGQGSSDGRPSYSSSSTGEKEGRTGFDAGDSSFADILQQLFGSASRGTSTQDRRRRVHTPDQPSEQAQTLPVEVSLEEAFRGAGRTVQQGNTRFEVTIPPGVRTGSRVRVRGMAGELYLQIQVRPHPRFGRDGDDLQVKVPVDLYTALLGGDVRVPTLERPVALAIPAATQNGSLFRLKGLGMPHLKDPGQRGNLLVEIDVLLPEHLNEEEKRLFERLRTMRR
jgi:curved DNA-binding protein